MTVGETIFTGASCSRSPVSVGDGRILVSGLAPLARVHRLGLAKLCGRLVERFHGFNVSPVGPEVKPHRLEFQKEWMGTQAVMVWHKDASQERVVPSTFYVKRKEKK